ncbi:SpoIIE family protein phosphatase [Alkalihalobacillus sp. MEB130]|uniref:PP2C family protein-serine/threonine phosphatase n=1 Tax=Alkalihalobacillus sp. MEB130 TaxID=2976704 RepID=UPI0028DF9968|nr:SpoIIE family protein phosphatase [Alkalihalobacillus sp. MEB130]MDT8861391.1 SpoIIE family protein phosphatase [Alkalihalobacillus sp. MEB130]
MNEQLNNAPCGFLTLTKEGTILSINQTLLITLRYKREQILGEHINTILSVPAQLFYQLYFVPLVQLENKIEEMHTSLLSMDGEEIPVIVNALPKNRNDRIEIDCIFIPIQKRSQYESELLLAKKEAEAALLAKHQANAELQKALEELKQKQSELLELNEENQTYKINTEKQLALARKIQETSLTDSIYNEQIEIASYYEASNDLSGDIYGLYQIDSYRYGIILLDVMGHGISSALITMSLQSLFQRLISKGVKTDAVMKELDNHLHNLFQNNKEAWHYCTAINLFIDTKEKRIEYINAGHPPAFWQNMNGQMEELHSTTPPLGTFEGINFQTKTFTYHEGGRLFLYTDGVTDPLGTDFVCSLLHENSSMTIAKLKDQIIGSLESNLKSYDKSDDQCFILVDLK